MKVDKKDQGARLKQAREEKGISLAEAEEATRIKAVYLAALESSDWGALPSEVQARGFLRNYASFLELDPDEGLVEVTVSPSSSDQGEMTRGGETLLGSSIPTTQDGTIFKPRDISLERLPRSWTDLLTTLGALLLVLAVAAAGVWLIQRGLGSLNQPSQAATQSSEALIGTATATVGVDTTPTSSPQLTTPTPTFAVSSDNVQLVVEAVEHVWGRVTVDGAVVFEGVFAPDDPQTWQGTRYVMIETGNGAGLRATVNGQPQGPLGERGEIVALAWSPAGPVAPVSTPTPQPSATPTPEVETPTEEPAEGP